MSLREKAIEGIGPKDRFSFTRTFDERDVAAFGDLTRDYNPVHYDSEYAKIKGFDRLICHGLLTGAMVCELGGQLAWLATGMRFSFLRPVYVGDTVTCTLTILAVDENRFARAEARIVNQNDEQVLLAELEGFLPGPEEGRRLEQMVAQGDPTNKLAGRT